jgi:hypothetical protein
MRRHLSYANVAATLALVFSMSGGALAAKHYLINSTKQINPNVLKKLTGQSGRNGATGPTGAAGAVGSVGAPGAKGEKGEVGPAGIGPAFGAFHDPAVEITSTIQAAPTTIATLSNLPPGQYAINAKLYVYDTNSSGDIIVCTLSAGGDSDLVVGHLSSSASAGYADSITTYPLQVLHQFNGTGSATVACYGTAYSGSGAFANWTKITAVRVSSLTNTGV